MENTISDFIGVIDTLSLSGALENEELDILSNIQKIVMSLPTSNELRALRRLIESSIQLGVGSVDEAEKLVKLYQKLFDLDQ